MQVICRSICVFKNLKGFVNSSFAEFGAKNLCFNSSRNFEEFVNFDEIMF